MNRVSLLFGIHMHQPVDNFSECIEEAVQKSYQPFFEVMMQYPEFKFAVHCSGWLLDRIRQNYPQLFSMMQTLTQKGSIEWVTAGYYEPVLSSIPSKDRVAQINKLSGFIQEHFGVYSKGLWLTERVWESAIVPDLVKSGVEYVLVDDYHFLSSAFPAKNLDGYYVTEEGGEESALFPISKSLRYLFPFSDVQKAIEGIVAYGKHEHSAAIFFDDGEKFGLWPHTFEWVYAQGWLEQFVKAVLEDERIISEHYSEYKQKNRSLGIAYLNNTSYFEMGEWSLKNEDAKEFMALKQQVGEKYFESKGVAFVKGGIWKNFFVKYPESNYLHKRMLHLSSQSESFTPAQLEALYKLQTNDVFWHGVFGGVYLPNLRDNAYRYLLEIEKGFGSCETQFVDINKDGYEEIKVRTDELSLVFSLKEGGALMEFGSFETLFNWQNTLMRKEESYHHQNTQKEQTKETIESIHDEAVMEDSLRRELAFDLSPRYSFMDRFSEVSCDLQSLKECKGELYPLGESECKVQNGTISFLRKGRVFENQDVEVTKNYTIEKNKITFSSQIKTQMSKQSYYALEFNFHFAHLDTLTINGRKLIEDVSEKGCKEIVLYDDFTNKILRIKSEMECDLYGYIANSIAKSESGFSKTPQQATFILSFPLQNNLDLSISLEICNV